MRSNQFHVITPIYDVETIIHRLKLYVRRIRVCVCGMGCGQDWAPTRLWCTAWHSCV